MSLLCPPPAPPSSHTHTQKKRKKKKRKNTLVSSDQSQYKQCVFTNLLFIETDNLKNAVVAFLFQLYRQGGSNEWTQHRIYRNFSEIEFIPDVFIQRRRKRGGGGGGGGGGAGPQ